MSERLHIALLGCGQLGGSFTLGLREAGAELFVTAYDPAPAHAETLKARGAVDAVCASPAEAATHADMVLFAAPLRSYRTLAYAIAPVVENGTIITDLGSVKQSMHALAPLLPHCHLVPAHPIAGSEKSGPSAARIDLFKNKLCIVTPNEDSDENAFAAVQSLWEMVGAEVIAMPAPVHDQIYAHVSHLPHYIAFVAASVFHQLGVRVTPADEMLQRFLRISRSNPRMWTDVALENREALLPVLGTYLALLEHFVRELRTDNSLPPRGRDRVGAELAPPMKNNPQSGRVAPLLTSPLRGEELLPLAQNYLPRVLASSLISCVSLYEQQSGQQLRPFGGAGMRDISAPAAAAPEADMEAMSNHAVAMAEVIESTLPYFRTLESLIGAEDEPALYAAISQMVEDAHVLAQVRS